MELRRKVRWQREAETSTAVPYMFEPNSNNHWHWVRYNVSKVYKSDKEYLSKGYASFINAKNCGYEIVEARL